MKSPLIHNFTKHDARLFGEFLRKNKMFNAHVLLDGDKLTADVAKLINRYSLNILLPLECIEVGHQSIAAIEKRNPGFTELLATLPASKVEILYTTKMNCNPSSLLSLALSYPNHAIIVRRDPEAMCSFYDVQGVIQAFSQADTPITNVEWAYDLSRNYAPIDYGMLKELGLVGEQECLVMTK